MQSSAGPDAAAEMARFGAAKERKHSRDAGIALFNRCAPSIGSLLIHTGFHMSHASAVISKLVRTRLLLTSAHPA